MDDEQRRHARHLLDESERHYRLRDHHQGEGTRYYNEYRALMRTHWDGSVAGEGDGG